MKWCNRRAFLGISLLAASLVLPAQVARSAEPLVSWEAIKYFRYNIDSAFVEVDALGKRDAVVYFSVSNPMLANRAWDIKNDAPFTQQARLVVDIGWDTSDYQNTGAAGQALQPLGFGKGAALPIAVDALKNAVPAGNNIFKVTAPLPEQAKGTGVVAIEGRPSWPVQENGVTVYARVPVQNVFAFFVLSGTEAFARRQVVAIEKCMVCHIDKPYDGGIIPRLSLHGNSRTEEPQVCVICHNPNQTDIPYRTTGTEVSIDFKRMIHSIHAGGMHHAPFTVVGHQGTVYDFSSVRFPRDLSDCLNCHIEVNGKGTFELPLAKTVLGSTIVTGSVPGSMVDVNPANDLKITPIAAVCSSCHDSSEAKRHMKARDMGGAFAVLQADIDSGKVVERCANCHGPGRKMDLRRVHEVGEDQGKEFDED